MSAYETRYISADITVAGMNTLRHGSEGGIAIYEITTKSGHKLTTLYHGVWNKIKVGNKYRFKICEHRIHGWVVSLKEEDVTCLS